MKKLSTVFLVLAILIVGLGFYQGWFALSRPASEPGSTKINVNVAADPEKMKQDARAVKSKVTELTDGVRENEKVEGQKIDIVRSNSPQRTPSAVANDKTPVTTHCVPHFS